MSGDYKKRLAEEYTGFGGAPNKVCNSFHPKLAFDCTAKCNLHVPIWILISMKIVSCNMRVTFMEWTRVGALE